MGNSLTRRRNQTPPLAVAREHYEVEYAQAVSSDSSKYAYPRSDSRAAAREAQDRDYALALSMQERDNAASRLNSLLSSAQAYGNGYGYNHSSPYAGNQSYFNPALLVTHFPNETSASSAEQRRNEENLTTFMTVEMSKLEADNELLRESLARLEHNNKVLLGELNEVKDLLLQSLGKKANADAPPLTDPSFI